MSSTFTVSVPALTDSENVHRYVEVAKNRTTSKIYLYAKNKNTYSIKLNLTETIPKTIAQSASLVKVNPGINYTIVQDDPVIMWAMDLSPGQEKSVSYTVNGDLGNSNLFSAPTTAEARASSTATTGGGGDYTIWLIIITLVIVGGVVVYLFVLNKGKGLKLPEKYAIFQKGTGATGVINVIKAIPAIIASAFKREKLEEGKKDEAPVIKIVTVKEPKPIMDRIKGIFGGLRKKKIEEKPKEEPKKETLKAPAKPKPSKDEFMNKLKEVYK